MNIQGLPLILKGIGIQEKQCTIFRKQGSVHDQLIYSISGQGILEINNQKYTVKSDEIVFLKSNEKHRYFSSGEDWKTGWIIFSGAHIKETLTALGLTESAVYSTTPIVNRLFKEMLSLNSETNEGLLSTKIYEILVLLRRDSIEKVPESLKIVLDLIETDFQTVLTLEMMANLLKVTPQYFCKLFKEKMAITPIEYLKIKRLSAAKEMLLNTQMSIKDIAVAVGYPDPSYFSLIFKRNEGMTARAYRGY